MAANSSRNDNGVSGLGVPAFLKYAYAAIAGGCLAWYLMFGVSPAQSSTRALEAAQTGPSAAYLWALGGAVAFAIAVVAFVLGKARA